MKHSKSLLFFAGAIALGGMSYYMSTIGDTVFTILLGVCSVGLLLLGVIEGK